MEKPKILQVVIIVLLIVMLIGLGATAFVFSSRINDLEGRLAEAEEELSRERIGVLNIQKIIEESPVARVYQAQLDEIGEEIERQFQERIEGLGDAERQALQQEAYEQYMQAKTLLEGELDEKIKDVVREVKEDKNLDLVIYSQGVRFGGEDITPEVIERLE